jgi:hypothetical protein
MTNKEIISEVVNDLRALQVDDRVSERYVLSKLRYYNALFLKRENDQLRLFYDNNIWTPIDCLQMEPIDAVQCLDIRIPISTPFARSVHPIPEIYSYKNGPIIREVSPLDGAKTYLPSTPNDYLKIIKREYRDPNQRYYWFQGDHLVVANSQQLKLTLNACFVDAAKAKLLNSCGTDQSCTAPGHLVGAVKQETLKDLFNFYKRNIKDEVSDLDNNTKTENASKGK